MNLPTTEPYHILHVEMVGGKRGYYRAPRFCRPDPLASQLSIARLIKAKPLYAIRVTPKIAS